ncbi:MAG: hypothetical protein A2268_17040 [Candidatus Raymondbacteria bacterium RifOxyA12_full_50_37]|uniref:PASTA domain-containing protein n=1 Tax=Candidatus Raymondbacteria bacterium RIFOXYD12_FULL_49_13 TaxID=1817890 RepID=A0A1F7FCQ5_UNCRA|nr:MAG: hypothetical protein A2268_17040 [Candidatus Raymondbacteria bacterium RifOxyA12_full_50_37]OGJ86314.1 MAG: hypothetical protein A2248_16640 [Candidatus Raymondbacteria bacterium RIFOXYA2_FULL_49_16]OGJ89997.1 MAG: hypothetical protein A2350_08095 [Candidatus Raymondbacteria bacterium RifOxyB12_full_50_8]OGJ95852.1 MAG: hypothetical protein A2453_11950 [Candidatus Raymondbacteria bacterium RIFOXYC2_FULL_50_21]OGK04418.1 MAG: hypothetical protein A2519_18615 [Candidatus Raymondbacteria b
MKRAHAAFAGLGRLRVLRILFLAGFCVVLSRFFYVQVIHFQHYAKLGENQSTRRMNLFPARGAIVDAIGVPLAINADVPYEAINDPEKPVKKKDRDAESQKRTERFYPRASLAGQVIGFVGRDGYGLAGIEFGFDRSLYGQVGWMLVRQDARQRKLFDLELPRKEPEDGYTLALTIDTRIQEIVEECLREGVESTGAKSGTAIVMHPRTGAILGMANYPFFDPNAWISENRSVWANSAVAKVYEPGSTFKLVTAAAAFEEGLVAEDDILHTGDGKLKIFDEYIHDTHKNGDITFRQAITVSSNIAFAKVASKVGAETLFRYIRDFGFGQKTGIDLPGEENGLAKPLSRWSGRTLVTIAMGHEISVTPIQLAAAYSAIANKGVLVAPHVVRFLKRKNEVVQEQGTNPIRRVVSEKTAERLTACFRNVVENKEGTGYEARLNGLAIAGKTGTAEKIDPATGLYQRNKIVASFVGFFPAEEPEVLCLVLLDEPVKVHSGGVAAAPIFRKITQRMLHSQELDYGVRFFAKTPVAAGAGATEKVRAPDFSGLCADSVLARAERARVCVRISGSGQTAASQSMTAGDEVFPGEIIRVSMGGAGLSKKVTVPNVVGLPLREAVGRLNLLGISIKISGRGAVVRQSPAAGAILERGSACSLTAG